VTRIIVGRRTGFDLTARRSGDAYALVESAGL